MLLLLHARRMSRLRILRTNSPSQTMAMTGPAPAAQPMRVIISIINILKFADFLGLPLQLAYIGRVG